MEQMVFKSANMPVAECAKALGVSEQTVRVMCQQNIVPWGKAVKTNPQSRHYQYFISPKGFYEATGYYYAK